jgi:hypothetical protein
VCPPNEQIRFPLGLLLREVEGEIWLSHLRKERERWGTRRLVAGTEPKKHLATRLLLS